MPRERVTRRQKDVSRLLREKRQSYKDKLRTFRCRRSLKSVSQNKTTLNG